MAKATMQQVQDLWAAMTTRLKSDLGETQWRSWIKPLQASALEDGRLTLVASSRLTRERVISQYLDKIRMIASVSSMDVQDIEVILRTSQSVQRANVPPRMTEMPFGDGDKLGANEGRNADIAIGPEGFDARFTFDNFVVAKPNDLAYAAARRVAEADDVTPSFNPLFLYGGVGLGKTHLMHAIAWESHKRDPKRNVIYLTAEKFMNQFVAALRRKDTMSFKERFRAADVLMVDDVQFMSGKESIQEEFFHTLNAIVEEGRQVILSADKSPSDLDGVKERLRSRMGWGMVADIHPTNYELRLGILQSRREGIDANIHVPDDVLEFLARKITTNIRELEGALNRIVAHASLVGRTVTVEMAREVLADLLRASNRLISIEDIQRHVSSHYNIRTNDMFSSRRAASIARPRQIAMYLAKDLTSLSYPAIGRSFGGRDHTTVMHAVKKIEQLIAEDSSLSADLDLLRGLLSDGA
ncbi:MAG: chromosomal replication initiator protein DnaA [Candidatus Puniceispirillaceae bacterium]